MQESRNTDLGGSGSSPSILLLLCHKSSRKIVTITSFTHVSLNIKTVRIWAHNLSKLDWHIDLMTCYIDIITCQEALGKPYIVVRDVPSRRRSSRKVLQTTREASLFCFFVFFQRVGNDVVSCCEFRSRLSRKLGSN